MGSPELDVAQVESSCVCCMVSGGTVAKTSSPKAEPTKAAVRKVAVTLVTGTNVFTESVERVRSPWAD